MESYLSSVKFSDIDVENLTPERKLSVRRYYLKSKLFSAYVSIIFEIDYATSAVSCWTQTKFCHFVFAPTLSEQLAKSPDDNHLK